MRMKDLCVDNWHRQLLSFGIKAVEINFVHHKRYVNSSAMTTVSGNFPYPITGALKQNYRESTSMYLTFR